ncbi:M15 family metallopeptidase [Streptococcus sciuri]|uniref:D-alanyl-D-alanine carboxypeptidase family protein n=1 Tax=Streptococcus sciuri TaxID=2973939 RepID=A0ABT2F978_9STRE|nr:D-alanyl-D-alanine carboxypeptidase family protein [Streptococcus sciuri]MCS4488960.1 D-alanyl-D-alanine carboxypeptidase family protein [Streptococcus sciuri]
MKTSFVKRLLFGIVVIVFILAIIYFVGGKRDTKQPISTTKTSQSTASSNKKTSSLPNVSVSDWELVLVNRDHITKEMNPELATVNGISVDARIAANVESFLSAAQAIDSSEHLISGYRSVSYQEGLFNSYVQQEMAANPSLSESDAETLVKTYSQPAGASEHQTGLAIDMSTVDALNQSDITVAKQVQALAPQYGFVLRFPKGKSSSTGVDYEDWHFRYVGKKSAEYMTKHNLTLEEYVSLLEERDA